MTPAELKKSILSKKMPNKMIWVDQNHTLVEHYLSNISDNLNLAIGKYFDLQEAISNIPLDYNLQNTLYVLYIPAKEIEKLFSLLDFDVKAVAIVEEEQKTKIEQVVFDKLSKSACIAFLLEELYWDNKKKKKLPKVDPDEFEHLSRETIEELVDYFDSDLDLCMNEIAKLKALDLGEGSWEKPFKAIMDCLPKKDKRLRSLKWFSGGDIDTCQVLYNLYMKKFRALVNVPSKDQMAQAKKNNTRPPELKDERFWALLIKEAIWCESCILSGTIGDYVLDYLRVVESSLPEDFEVQYYPPVFHSQLKEFPEWVPPKEEQKNGK